ncbi:hypothetical protein N9544_02720 [Flavobacteriales bacterium]|nr:hypothetical protein [Flavobacteriales bacterium]
MIDDIINSLKGELGGSLMEKFGLDSNQKDQAMDITKETITDKISEATSGGGLSGIMNLFSSNDNDEEGNSMLEGITSTLSSKFSSQLGVDSEKSGGITSMIMEKVTSMFGDKLGGNFEVTDLLGIIGGGKSAGLGGMLGKLTGLFGK